MEQRKKQYVINEELFPEAGATKNCYFDEVEVVPPQPKMFKAFGSGPERELPTEWLTFCRKHIPAMLDNLYTEIQRVASIELDGINQDILVEWMEEGDFGSPLAKIVFNIACLSNMVKKED